MSKPDPHIVWTKEVLDATSQIDRRIEAIDRYLPMLSENYSVDRTVIHRLWQQRTELQLMRREQIREADARLRQAVNRAKRPDWLGPWELRVMSPNDPIEFGYWERRYRAKDGTERVKVVNHSGQVHDMHRLNWTDRKASYRKAELK